MSENDPGNSLQKPNAAIGSAIVDEATKRYQEQIKSAVIDVVTTQMRAIDDLEEQRRTIDLQLDHYRRSLAAVTGGDFTVVREAARSDRSGGARIVLNDPSLSLGHWHPETRR